VSWSRVEAAQGPGGKGQFREALDERVGDAGEDSGKVISHGDVDAVASFDDGEDGDDFGSGLLALTWIQFFRPMAPWRMEFSARLFCSS